MMPRIGGCSGAVRYTSNNAPESLVTLPSAAAGKSLLVALVELLQAGIVIEIALAQSADQRE